MTLSFNFGANRRERKPYRALIRHLTQARYDRTSGRQIDYVIEARANFAAELAKVTDENGFFGVKVSGADCDWNYFEYERLIKNQGAVKMWLWFCEEVDNDENRVDRHFVHPSEIDTSRRVSRDLSMEAYENGTPHYISWPG